MKSKVVIKQFDSNKSGHILDCARRMVEEWHKEFAISKNSNLEIRSEFNDTIAICKKGSTPDDIVNQWCIDGEKEAEAYAKSTEGRLRHRMSDLEDELAKAKCKLLFFQLKKLELNKMKELLNWIDEFCDVFYATTLYQRRQIVALLERHGFRISMNCREDLNISERCYDAKLKDKNFAGKYIVGQFLWIKNGYLHEGVLKLKIQQWREEFGGRIRNT